MAGTAVKADTAPAAMLNQRIQSLGRNAYSLRLAFLAASLRRGRQNVDQERHRFQAIMVPSTTGK